MKNKLSFVDMQTFINVVVDGVMENGLGYKQFYIEYCTAKFYGEYEFKSTNIDEIYETEIDEAINETFNNSINAKQYDTIIQAVDDEITYRQMLASRTVSFGETDIAIASFVDKLTNALDNILENYSPEEQKKLAEMANLLVENKNKFNPNTIVKALFDNGFLKKDTQELCIKGY